MFIPFSPSENNAGMTVKQYQFNSTKINPKDIYGFLMLHKPWNNCQTSPVSFLSIIFTGDIRWLFQGLCENV